MIKSRRTVCMFDAYKNSQCQVNGIYIHFKLGGKGPPLLLLHGHPQTHLMWHKVADELAQHFSVVAADLRGYGDSAKPPASAQHINHCKREMAKDQVELMKALGFQTFSILAHDRGARVAHRLAIDFPQCVTKMILLDIAPTLSMYEQTSNLFARLYWHWFFLIQKSPLPETLISANPKQYIESVMGNRHGGLAPFPELVFNEYVRCLSVPETATSICEDYRASAGIDLIHDKKDIENGNKIKCPLLVLWGEHGVIAQCFDPLKEWNEVALNVSGHSIPCGHYIAEESPKALLQEAISFLSLEHKN